jgi:hypothetical protein
MADLEAVRQQLQALKARLDSGAISPEEFEHLKGELTAELSAEEHIELGVMAASEGAATEAAAPPQAPGAEAAPPAEPEPPAAPGMPAFPDLDDSMFDDPRTVTPDDASADAAPADGLAPDLADDTEPAVTSRRWLVPAIAAAVVVVVLIVVAVFALRPSGEADVIVGDSVAEVNRQLNESQALFEAGRGAEAVQRLERVLGQLPTADPGRARIEQRLESYRAELARPTPSPAAGIADEVATLLADGRTLSAYRRAVAGLELDNKHSELLEIEQRLSEEQPLLRSLDTALAEEDYTTAAYALGKMAEADPKDIEIGSELRRCLFNAAVLELRTHAIADAREHLDRLDGLLPGDPEVARMLQITDRYTKREPDAQLDIYAASLKLR